MTDKALSSLTQVSSLDTGDLVYVVKGGNSRSMHRGGFGFLSAANNLSEVGNAATAFNNIKQAATDTGTGVVQTATATDFRSNTAGKVLTTDDVWSAAQPVSITDTGTIGVDMSLGFDFTLTLSTNSTLGAPTNAKPGQKGLFIVSQDGTGSRTLAFHANYKFAGGTDFVVSTAASSKDIISYYVETSSIIHMLGIVKAMS